MKVRSGLVALSMAGLSSLVAVSAHAANVEMQVLPASDLDPKQNRCPEKVILTEQPRPYREGGFTIDGSANLNAIAGRLAIANSDDFSATWVATLKAPFSKCKATARISRVGNETFSGHSYLRMRFVGGKVYLILDMTGTGDANRFTNVILKKAVQNGNAVWSWGGTD